MPVGRADKAIEALQALKALQEDAKRKGLDKTTMDEIDAEIAAHRREKRLAKRSNFEPG
ncbi:Addiction module antitoxin, RelB/DinJ family (fragment) [Candidatus Sulfopaludibacter sp. SbA4]